MKAKILYAIGWIIEYLIVLPLSLALLAIIAYAIVGTAYENPMQIITIILAGLSGLALYGLVAGACCLDNRTAFIIVFVLPFLIALAWVLGWIQI